MTHFISTLCSILLTLHWGLGFPEDGKPPVGNASADFLRQYDAVYMGDPEQKTIYLTFDAGFENGNTAAILDALKEKNVPAAFFIVGHYVESSPELVRRMAQEGHLICNHTKRHPDMSKITDPAAFKKELDDLDDMVKQAAGANVAKYYRPPSGKYSEGNLKAAKKLGYKTVFWSLAYVDWHENNQPTHEKAMNKLTKRIHPGAVLLLHSTSRTNAEILPELIDKYREMGYTFGTLDDLYGQANNGAA